MKALPPLSPRQTEVARAIAWGHTDREIGHMLGISEETVANHLRWIYVRLGIRKRANLVAWVLSQNHGKKR